MVKDIKESYITVFILLFFVSILLFLTSMNVYAFDFERLKIDGYKRKQVKSIFKDIGYEIGIILSGKGYEEINDTSLIKKLNAMPKRNFEELVKGIINQAKLYDKLEYYVWILGATKYPLPKEYFECIVVDDRYVFYHDKSRKDFVSIPFSIIDKIIFKKYYKGILCEVESNDIKKNSYISSDFGVDNKHKCGFGV